MVKGKGWERVGWRRVDEKLAGDVHVLPINDTREHVESPQCWCRPKVQKIETVVGGWGHVITHNSKDGRELLEPGRVQ
jgi:hypothetical protein